MTIQDQSAVAETHQVSDIVFGTTKRVFGLYGQVKEYSPMLKNGLESVESRIPADWIERVGAASEPVLASLDQRVDDLSKAVTKTVVEPVTQTVQAVNQRVQDSVITPVNERALMVRSVVNERVIVPAKQLQKVDWKDLRGLGKKTIARLDEGLAGVREFSATRGKEIIHLDLIEYCNEVIDNASKTAKPVLLPVYQNLMVAVQKVSATAAALQEMVSAKSAQSQQQVEAMRAELTAKLHAAMAAARSLSASGAAFLQQKYADVQAKVPEQYRLENLSAKLPPGVQQSAHFILNSPQLFVDVKNKADLTTSKRALENIQSLVSAVREVVFSSDLARVNVAEGAQE